MSSANDANGADAYCNIAGGERDLPPQMLTAPQPTGVGGGISMPPPQLWTNQLLGTPFMQTQHPQQQPPQQQQQQQQQQHHQQQQQQQQYNEFLFNMHAAAQGFATSPGQPETYSVLPVGHGNFLKVYHCAENAASDTGSSGGGGGFYQQQHQQQQQAAQQFQQPQQQQHQPPPQMLPFHHMTQSQAPPAAAQLFNSYELFATSNTLLPTAPPENQAREMSPPQQQQQQALPVQLQQSSPQPPLLLLNTSATAHEELAAPQVSANSSSSNNNSNTNMIINKLVNNWSPSLTGGTYTQFGTPLQAPADLAPPHLLPVNCAAAPQLMPHNQCEQSVVVPSLTMPSHATTILPQLQASLLAPLPTALMPPLLQKPLEMPTAAGGVVAAEADANTAAVFAAAATSPHLAAGSATAVAGPPEVKKRIVAEVKPMRMTYSDVLSKFNNQEQQQSSASTQPQNASKHGAGGKNGKTSAAPATQLNKNGTDANGGGSVRRQMNMGGASGGAGEEGAVRSTKKSPTHELKENAQPAGGAKNIKRTANSSSSNNGGGLQPKPPKSTQQQQRQNGSANGDGKKRANNIKRQDNDLQSDGGGSGSGGKSQKNGAAEKDFSGFYNVTAKHSSAGGDAYERPSKASSSNATASASVAANNSSNAPSSSSSSHSRKSNSNSKTGGAAYYANAQQPAAASASTANAYGANQSRSTRYSNNAGAANSNTNASSYSYSSKRNRGGSGGNYSSSSYSYGGGGSSSTSSAAGSPNRNYELAKRFLRAWFEYTLKVLTWLFYLIYDIVVLGFSMVYERLTQAYVCGLAYAQQLRRELQQNSNKPSIWLKNYWRRFDARFAKTSRWALWRRFYKKKPPETTTENFKNGRLPQTGEEAMYSLLNCKGKDAYSILGVPPDSSQEQIRKHYKKIAVLVHPDKNKQAGAEEAFKVLQRAFELIGEPENRMSYDQSLAEALHAEKAWTELHDLLSQLQTKITEAANTIRCSTCGLRHPRKVTDRPHYAARECASCKIRHSAREGDIWAETSLLGLRWKYLALMEGKVYDITEWANCQKGALSHLEPNSHMVQYRIVRGAQQQQQQQQQQQHSQQQQQQQQQAHQHHNHHQQQHHSPHHNHGAGGGGGGGQQQYQHPHGPAGGVGGSGKFKRDIPPSEASLHEFLDNLYSGQHPNQPNASAFANASRRRTRRN